MVALKLWRESRLIISFKAPNVLCWQQEGKQHATDCKGDSTE